MEEWPLCIAPKDLRFFEMHICAHPFYTTTCNPFKVTFQFRVTFNRFHYVGEEKGTSMIFMALKERANMGSMKYLFISSAMVIGRE